MKFSTLYSLLKEAGYEPVEGKAILTIRTDDSPIHVGLALGGAIHRSGLAFEETMEELAELPMDLIVTVGVTAIRFPTITWGGE